MSNEIENRTVFRVMSTALMFVIVAWLAFAVRHQLTWIGAGFVLAVALNPAVSYIAKYLPGRGRLLATIAVFTSFVLVATFIVLSLVPPVTGETKALIRSVPQYINDVERSNGRVGHFVRDNNIIKNLQGRQDQFVTEATKASGSVFGIVRGAFSGLLAIFTILAVTFFTLLEGPGLTDELLRFFPTSKRARYKRVGADIYDAVSGYVTGNLLIVAATAIVTTALMTITGIPYSVPVGLLVGLLTLLPFVGPSLGAFMVITLAALTSTTALVVMVSYFILYLLFEGHVVRPLVYGRTIQISPLLIIIAVVIGTAIGGLLGALVVIPVAASIKIIVNDYLDHSPQHKIA